MTSTTPVHALCVSPVSIYKTIPGVDAWDIKRDVRNFDGKWPVVAHPPCRSWSAYTAHQAKPAPGEKELGPLCVEILQANGGVLEHPAHSRLFDHCNLPKPGQRRGDLTTVYVEQAWWGYTMKKATWLVFCGVDPSALLFPYKAHNPRDGVGDRRRQQVMSKHQRAATHPALAHWLVDAARKVNSTEHMMYRQAFNEARGMAADLASSRTAGDLQQLALNWIGHDEFDDCSFDGLFTMLREYIEQFCQETGVDTGEINLPPATNDHTQAGAPNGV